MKVSISWNYKYEKDGYNYKTFDNAEEFVKWFSLNRKDVVIWDFLYGEQFAMQGYYSFLKS